MMMKRTLLALLATTTIAAHAGPYGHHHRHGGEWNRAGWVIPALIVGGIAGAAIARNAEPAPQPQVNPVIIPGNTPGAPVVCPAGTAAFYNRTFIQDYQGRYTEAFQFIGCR